MSGEVLESDPLHTWAHEIENITDPDEARERAKAYLDEGGFADFKLGGVLTRIEENDWTGDYSSFRDYVEAAIGVGYHKARRLIAIYSGLLELGVPWEKLAPLGWSKVLALLDVLTAENADAWIAKAQALTYVQTIEEVKAAKKAAATGQEQITSVVSTKTFKLHKDQRESVVDALAKAKKEAPTDVEAVALEHICQMYLSPGASQPKAKAGQQPGQPGYVWPDMKAMFDHMLIDVAKGNLNEAMKVVFSAFEAAFPTVQVTVKVD